MEWFIFWIGGAIGVGLIASNYRGRDGAGWFLLSLLISPLLGILFVLASRDLRKERALADTRICPYCAERIKLAAKVCRYCQHELPPPVLEASDVSVTVAAKRKRDVTGAIVIASIFGGFMLMFLVMALTAHG
jgi:hypothetical protein